MQAADCPSVSLSPLPSQKGKKRKGKRRVVATWWQGKNGGEGKRVANDIPFLPFAGQCPFQKGQLEEAHVNELQQLHTSSPLLSPKKVRPQPCNIESFLSLFLRRRREGAFYKDRAATFVYRRKCGKKLVSFLCSASSPQYRAGERKKEFSQEC